MGKLYITADRVYAFEPNSDAGIAVDAGAGLEINLKVGPNPARAGAVIEYVVPADCPVRLKVYDVRGRVVNSLFDGRRAAGHYRVEWAGKSQSGGEVAPGIYFVRLETGKQTRSQKLVYLK
jgi:hypothetical protein